MKVGEYGLHVYIQETSDLTGGEEAEIDPIIKIEGFGLKKTTKVKSNVGNEDTYWGEHFFFEKIFTERSNLEDQTV